MKTQSITIYNDYTGKLYVVERNKYTVVDSPKEAKAVINKWLKENYKAE